MVDPGAFLKDSFRNKEIAPGIEIILGKKTGGGPMEVQAYRFSKEKFTPEEAHAWLKKEGKTPISFENADESQTVGNLASIDNEGSFSHSSHDVRLQRLDISLPYSRVPSGKLKYDVDNFAGTEGAWDKTLAVFVPPGVPIQHVDHVAFANDPHCEAARLGYKIAGHHENTNVISKGPGEPRMMTKAVFTDPEADRLATEGKLSVSSGFDANIDSEGSRMVGPVRPNHVLYFLRGQPTAFGTEATPNDLGAMVDNISEEVQNVTAGCRIAIGDIYPQKNWADLTDEQKDHIRSLFLYVSGDAFDDCHLPYKDPASGKVKSDCLRNALARLDQVAGMSAEEKDRIRKKAQKELEQVNNISGESFMDDKDAKTLLEKIAEKVDNIRDHTVPKPEDLSAQLDNVKMADADKAKKIKELEDQIAAAKEEIDELKKNKEELDNIRKEAATKAKDEKWTQVKNLFKPGMFHKAEDEGKFRTEFETDAGTFMLANVSNLASTPIKAPAMGSSVVSNVSDSQIEGLPVTNVRQADGTTKEVIDVRKAIGRYDPKTKGMVQ